MKTTGIVRRIDDLGRVVIPKEIRRTMKIKEGEEVEVFVAPQNTVVLKKYSAVSNLAELSKNYTDTMYQITLNNCFICDLEGIVACGCDGNIYQNQNISAELTKIIKERKTVMLSGDKVIPLIKGDSKAYKEMFISPIINSGDVYGAVILATDKKLIGETGMSLVKITSGFLSKQIS